MSVISLPYYITKVRMTVAGSPQGTVVLPGHSPQAIAVTRPRDLLMNEDKPVKIQVSETEREETSISK